MSAFSQRPNYYLWIAILILGMGAGVAGVVNVLIAGHGHAYNVTREIPWGLLIATYVFLVASTTGLCLVSSLGHVFGIKQFNFICKRAILLGIITLLCGFGTLGMELNHPIRMAIYAVISPNFSSAITWMGIFYGCYLVLLCAEFYYLITGSHKGAYALGMLGFFAAIAANSNLGGVFSMLEARPYWHGSFYPTYIILSSLVSGGAIISLIVYFIYKQSRVAMPPRYEEFMRGLGKLQALFITILMFFVIWKIIPGLYGRTPGLYESTMTYLTGPLAFNFWFFEVLIGMLIPVILLLNRRTRTPLGVMWAGVFSIVGMFFMRYDMVVAGQLVSMRTGTASLVNGLLQYSPSMTEIAITVGAVCTCLFLYTLAERLLPLDSEEH